MLLHLVQGLPEQYFSDHLGVLNDLRKAAGSHDRGMIDLMITTINYGLVAFQNDLPFDVMSQSLSQEKLDEIFKLQASPTILSGPTTCSSPKQQPAREAAQNWPEAWDNIVYGRSLSGVRI